MRHTPFFPAWSAQLNPLGSRSLKTLRCLGSLTLCQLETCLGSWVPVDLFPKAARHQNSRHRDYTPARTFWCMLWQGFNPSAPGREVVRQLQALFDLENRRQLSPNDGAYCRAKARVPLDPLPKGLRATAKTADQLAPAQSLLRGRSIKAVDGSTLTLPETPGNRAAYPPIPSTDTPTFPLLRWVALFSLLSGALVAVAEGAWGTCYE